MIKATVEKRKLDCHLGSAPQLGFGCKHVNQGKTQNLENNIGPITEYIRAIQVVLITAL